MLQNQNLCDFTKYWAEKIATNEKLQQFCQTNFGKSLTVIIAPPEYVIPTAEDTPCVYLHEPTKNEGAKQTTMLYSFIVSVGIVTEEQIRDLEISGVKVATGQELLCEMLSLIQDIFNEDCKVPANIEQNVPTLSGADPTYWVGFMTATWEVEIPMGGTNYFE